MGAERRDKDQGTPTNVLKRMSSHWQSCCRWLERSISRTVYWVSLDSSVSISWVNLIGSKYILDGFQMFHFQLPGIDEKEFIKFLNLWFVLILILNYTFVRNQGIYPSFHWFFVLFHWFYIIALLFYFIDLLFYFIDFILLLYFLFHWFYIIDLLFYFIDLLFYFIDLLLLIYYFISLIYYFISLIYYFISLIYYYFIDFPVYFFDFIHSYFYNKNILFILAVFEHFQTWITYPGKDLLIWYIHSFTVVTNPIIHNWLFY